MIVQNKWHRRGYMYESGIQLSSLEVLIIIASEQTF